MRAFINWINSLFKKSKPNVYHDPNAPSREELKDQFVEFTPNDDSSDINESHNRAFKQPGRVYADDIRSPDGSA